MAVDAEFFEDIPNHRLAIDFNGHSFEFPGTGVDLHGLHPSREELEFRISGALQMLGGRRLEAVVYTRRQQHSHRHCLHGCAFDLFVERTAFEENAVGYTCGVPAQYPVSNLLILINGNIA